MATVKFVEESEAQPEVRAIFQEIKEAFGLPFVPNLFRAMAHNPVYLGATWNRIKGVMGQGVLDRRTKEMIAVAVSAVNNCEYCVNAHTAALRRLGVTDAELVELMAVVDLFSGLNKFLDGLRVESDLRP
jgi:AhpD family alkylhydroperoxidase